MEPENPRSEVDECDEISTIPRWDSLDSNLSFISASQSMDDTFQEKISLEQVKAHIMDLLSKHMNQKTSSGIENVLGLVSLLGECLEEYKQQAQYLKQSAEQKDGELFEMKNLFDEKMKNIYEENRTRISNIISSNEKQLSTAVERAINARRQAEVLQFQLNESRSKVTSLEQKCNENYLQSLSQSHSHFQQYSDEMNQLLKKLNKLEVEKESWIKEKETLMEEKKNLSDNLRQMEVQAEHMKETEESFLQQLEEKDNELSKERSLNQNLWSENDKCAQEIAVLNTKLDVASKELEHRSQVLSIVKRENSEYLERERNNSNEFAQKLEIEIQSEDERVKNLDKLLKEKKRLKAKLEDELLQVETYLKKKSVQIQMNSDRAASFNQRLKYLEEQILHTSTSVAVKEMDLKNLADKLQAREIKLNNLARKVHQEKLKTSQLDTSLKMSQARERTLSEKLRNIKLEETHLENDITLHQSRSESLLKVLQSRQNIIEQLEREDEKTEARLTQLFEKNLPTASETFHIESSKISVLSDNENLSSITGQNSFSNESCVDHRDFNTSGNNYDHLDMSLTQTFPVEIISNQTDREGIDMEATLGRNDQVAIDVTVAPHKSNLPPLSNSDTDSGISFVTEGFRAISLQDPTKHLQSTPLKNEDLSFKNNQEDSFKPEKCDNHLLINLFQPTARVRHNSLPSSAGKNRLRYRTKLQDCLPNYTLMATHEQSSQTSTSSYLETSRHPRASSDIFVERQPADGVEPVTNK